jgi:GTP-sensing pleiotropic transcriptional regulator CodY
MGDHAERFEIAWKQLTPKERQIAVMMARRLAHGPLVCISALAALAHVCNAVGCYSLRKLKRAGLLDYRSAGPLGTRIHLVWDRLPGALLAKEPEVKEAP